MYLTESERKRIKKLYEASSASGAGSYETPMGFKAERPEMIGELPDEIDITTLGLEAKKRMPQLSWSQTSTTPRTVLSH